MGNGKRTAWASLRSSGRPWGRAAGRVVAVLSLCALPCGCTLDFSPAGRSYPLGADTQDSSPPYSCAIALESGAVSTSSPEALFALSAWDDVAVTAYLLSESSAAPAADDAAWTPVAPAMSFAGSAPFRLSGGYGKKNVFAWYKDAAENISDPASVSINLDFVTKGAVAAPNIIVIVVDTLRADHLSTYGYERLTDPNLAEFAKQAVVFDLAIAPAPWTLPSYTSILESVMAFQHNRNTLLSSDVLIRHPPEGTVLTPFFRNAGYKTVAIQTNSFLRFLESGDYFDERYYFTQDTVISGELNWDEPLRTLDTKAVDKTSEWLQQGSNTANPFFAFIGLISPHWEYKTNNGYLDEFFGDALFNASHPEIINIWDGHPDCSGCWTYSLLNPYMQSLIEPPLFDQYYKDARLYVAGYDAEVKYADAQLGKILQALKDRNLYDDSLIVITADHGEDMAEHWPYFNHLDNLYQSLLHVPLLIKFPGQKTQRFIPYGVRTIDILPTVFDYAGISYEEADGKSLLPVINAEEVNFDDRPVISYREYIDGSGNAEICVIKDGYKLVRNKNRQTDVLYSLADDPDETADLSQLFPERVLALKNYLGRYFTQW